MANIRFNQVSPVNISDLNQQVIKTTSNPLGDLANAGIKALLTFQLGRQADLDWQKTLFEAQESAMKKQRELESEILLSDPEFAKAYQEQRSKATNGVDQRNDFLEWLRNQQGVTPNAFNQLSENIDNDVKIGQEDRNSASLDALRAAQTFKEKTAGQIENFKLIDLINAEKIGKIFANLSEEQKSAFYSLPDNERVSWLRQNLGSAANSMSDAALLKSASEFAFTPDTSSLDAPTSRLKRMQETGLPDARNSLVPGTNYTFAQLHDPTYYSNVDNFKNIKNFAEAFKNIKGGDPVAYARFLSSSFKNDKDKLKDLEYLPENVLLDIILGNIDPSGKEGFLKSVKNFFTGDTTNAFGTVNTKAMRRAITDVIGKAKSNKDIWENIKKGGTAENIILRSQTEIADLLKAYQRDPYNPDIRKKVEDYALNLQGIVNGRTTPSQLDWLLNFAGAVRSGSEVPLTMLSGEQLFNAYNTKEAWDKHFGGIIPFPGEGKVTPEIITQAEQAKKELEAFIPVISSPTQEDAGVSAKLPFSPSKDLTELMQEALNTVEKFKSSDNTKKATPEVISKNDKLKKDFLETIKTGEDAYLLTDTVDKKTFEDMGWEDEELYQIAYPVNYPGMVDTSNGKYRSSIPREFKNFALELLAERRIQRDTSKYASSVNNLLKNVNFTDIPSFEEAKKFIDSLQDISWETHSQLMNNILIPQMDKAIESATNDGSLKALASARRLSKLKQLFIEDVQSTSLLNHKVAEQMITDEVAIANSKKTKIADSDKLVKNDEEYAEEPGETDIFKEREKIIKAEEDTRKYMTRVSKGEIREINDSMQHHNAEKQRKAQVNAFISQNFLDSAISKRPSLFRNIDQFVKEIDDMDNKETSNEFSTWVKTNRETIKRLKELSSTLAKRHSKVEPNKDAVLKELMSIIIGLPEDIKNRLVSNVRTFSPNDNSKVEDLSDDDIRRIIAKTNSFFQKKK